MRLYQRSLSAAAIAAAACLIMSACASTSGDAPEPSGEASESAAPSGTLTWYSSQNPTMEEATIEAFTELYPDVNIELLHLPTGELSVRYSQERTSDSSEADLVSLADPAFYTTGVESDWWDTSATPAEGFPEDELNDGVAKIGILPAALSYNTDLVPSADAPTSWEDATDPMYAGKLLLTDPRNVPAYLATVQVWQDEYGDEFLEAIAAQNPQLVPSVVPGNQSLGAGAGMILIPSTTISARAVQDQGGPVEFLTVGPTTGSESYAAIPSNAPNPVAAQAFYEFLTSKEGQEVYNGIDGVAIREDAEGTAPLPDGYVPLNDVLPRAVENRAELLSLLGIE